MQTGWISIHRSIKDHWLYPKNREMTKYEAWLCILMEVNHKTNKELKGFNLKKCKRGESIKSLETWAKLFNWNKSKVRRFFGLLQKDLMIVTKSVQKTTHLTVLNYDTYQGDRHKTETILNQSRHDIESILTPNNNVNNNNNDLINKKSVKIKKPKPIKKPALFEIEADENKKIPSYNIFKNYALGKSPNVNLEKLSLKYESWKVNGWKDGNNKKIQNWRSKLLNTLSFISNEKSGIMPSMGITVEQFEKGIGINDHWDKLNEKRANK